MAVLFPLSPVSTMVAMSVAEGGLTVLDAAEQSTLLTQTHRRKSLPLLRRLFSGADEENGGCSAVRAPTGISTKADSQSPRLSEARAGRRGGRFGVASTLISGGRTR